jgi:hypothetical protein
LEAREGRSVGESRDSLCGSVRPENDTRFSHLGGTNLTLLGYSQLIDENDADGALLVEFAGSEEKYLQGSATDRE